MTFRGILFDKDGTLFDLQATWGQWAVDALGALADGDAAVLERLGEATGVDLQNARMRPDSLCIAATPSEIAAALEPHLKGRSHSNILETLLKASYDVNLAPATPLAPLLHQLRADGYALGVATNDSENVARAHLDEAGVLALFDFVVGFDSGHGGKPDPGMCLAFAHVQALPPREVVMVGDSTHDLEAGRAAGMATVGVLTGAADQAALAPLADVVLPSIAHLPDWLGAPPAT